MVGEPKIEHKIEAKILTVLGERFGFDTTRSNDISKSFKRNAILRGSLI